MLLDLRSLWEEQPADTTNPHLVGVIGRKLKAPYTDAPGKPARKAPARQYHDTGRVGWKRLSGTRRVRTQALAVSAVGAATAVTVRLQPRPISAEILPEGIKIIPPVVQVLHLREAPRFGSATKSVRVQALAEGRAGSVTTAHRRLDKVRRLVADDDELLLGI